MRLRTVALVLCAVLVAIAAACNGNDAGDPPTPPAGNGNGNGNGAGNGDDLSDVEARPAHSVTVNGHTLHVELATTREDRAQGLMHRESLPADQGMLFVYKEPKELSYWMRNTLIPLDIAYLDEDGRILNILHMQPHDEGSHPSAGRAKFALETNQGWFAAHDVQAGDVVRISAEIRSIPADR